LRFTSTNSIIESLLVGPSSPRVSGGWILRKSNRPSSKKTASGLRPFNSIILACLSIHSENTGGVFLIINRESTAAAAFWGKAFLYHSIRSDH
jgi:hypothetical protein